LRNQQQRLIVQQSFPEPRPTTNPYLVMLRQSIAAAPGVEVRTFSWRAALLGRYSVFHVHWPEILAAGRTPTRTIIRQLLLLALLLKLRLSRTPIVRTLHNLERPAGISRRANALLTLVERQTTLVILLNTSTVPPPGVKQVTIPHGHYRDWFARYQRPTQVPGRLSYFGLIRPYKGVETLARVFRELPGGYTLRIAGNPTPELRQSLLALAAMDDRICLTLSYLPDEELVTVVCKGELVVLPYLQMHNSGGALTALSLGRPVLMPANEVNDRLRREVGEGWVYTYTGELTSRHLLDAIEYVRTTDRTAEPDLSQRGWDRAGREHVEAYRLALDLRS
jgi:beta-1,4-mannosyltransferase